MQNELPAASGKTKTLIVLLHGVGSNGDDLFSLAPFLAQSLPDVHFFAPDGIESCDMGPFGYQWFSLQNRDEAMLRSELERVAPKIRALIKNKAEELGLGLQDVILLGFSQGTMTSLYLALTSEVDYKALVGFSGALVLPKEPRATKTPIFLSHGTEDDILDHSSMERAEKFLRDLGVNVETLSVPYLAHSIDMNGLDKAVSFIKKQLFHS
jgi:phospholipase/carboxylesterase